MTTEVLMVVIICMWRANGIGLIILYANLQFYTLHAPIVL